MPRQKSPSFGWKFPSWNDCCWTHPYPKKLGPKSVYNLSCAYKNAIKFEIKYAATWSLSSATLQRRHIEHHVVSNHQHHDCLLNTFIQAHVRETSKLCATGPLCGEFTEDRWIPRIKGQWRGKYFHMTTSSWENTIVSLTPTIHTPSMVWCCELINKFNRTMTAYFFNLWWEAMKFFYQWIIQIT